MPPADVCEQRQILFLRYIPAAIHIGAKCPVPHTCRGRVCHCSRVTTSTACPSSVTVLSMRVAMGAMATWTGRFPWAKLVTTVWYMLTGIWTRPGMRHRPVIFIQDRFCFSWYDCDVISVVVWDVRSCYLRLREGGDFRSVVGWGRACAQSSGHVKSLRATWIGPALKSGLRAGLLHHTAMRNNGVIEATAPSFRFSLSLNLPLFPCPAVSGAAWITAAVTWGERAGGWPISPGHKLIRGKAEGQNWMCLVNPSRKFYGTCRPLSLCITGFWFKCD